jgi:predicted AAA+ superfamily ATPase
MPHRRHRPLMDVIIKRLKLWPVCGVVGIRQCGKTVLLSQLLAPQINASYVSMDSLRSRRTAARAPEAFVTQTQGACPLIIDEVQKVPDLFDALKLTVDQDRRPGMYIISGSTEFSIKTGIRESLTGRVGISRLYPLTLAELYSANALGQYFLKPGTTSTLLSLSDFQRKVERGGMPGICFLRSEREVDDAWSGWLETTCYRDLNQVMKANHDGDLALAIIHALATVTEPTAASVAHEVRRDQRVVSRYLDAFTSIFVLHRLSPHPEGVGKNHYVFADSGLATYLGAPDNEVLRSHVLVEALAACEYAGYSSPIAQYFSERRGFKIPIILRWLKGKNAPEPIALRYFNGEDPDRTDFAPLIKFKQAVEPKARCLLLTQTSESYRESSIEVYPLRG